MKIVVFGAGAIGSLIGGYLTRNEINEVFLVGREPHIEKINREGLKIEGKTKFVTFPRSFKKMERIPSIPDLVILTVKSYDTESAMTDITPLVSKDTAVLSLQNGLGNEEVISKYVGENVIGGVTYHGATLEGPGRVLHAGTGKTVIGELDGRKTERIRKIASSFSKSGIDTEISNNIDREIWRKTIANSAINPLTALLKCKNGRLLENTYLTNVMKSVCEEAVTIANEEKGMDFSADVIFEETKKVTEETSENYSSMLQSIRNKNPTEIETMNGKIVEKGKKLGIETPANEVLLNLINSIQRIDTE